MGVVYKARDTHLDRFVAIKVLPPARVADPVRKKRFVQAAKAASALNHPNIVTIHDLDRAGSIDFIAMEFIDGKPLDEVIPPEGMPLAEALKYSVQIADALATAHGANIIHRDLKPGNVMVRDDGLVKVLDFGLAKLMEPGPPAGKGDETATMRSDNAPHTVKGTILGTPYYMSPEQAQGLAVDVRSDIFSFGSLLYEMVTGRRAFHGETTIATLSAILREEPKPLGTEVPHEMEKIISRCLRKDRERRTQHMDDVKLALEDLKEESDSGTGAASRAGGGGVGWARARRAVPLLVALAVAAGWFWYSAASSRPWRRKSFPKPHCAPARRTPHPRPGSYWRGRSILSSRPDIRGRDRRTAVLPRGGRAGCGARRVPG
jgi:serine/threonine protein kinase